MVTQHVLSVKNWEIAIKSRMWKWPLENQQAWECAKELERWVLNGHVGLSENRIPQIPLFIINCPIIWRSFWWYSLFSETPMWVNYNDLTATSLESWLTRGIIPKIAASFRLVNDYLPRDLCDQQGWGMDICWLVVWNIFIFHFIYGISTIYGMSSQPHWRTPSFFKMVF